MLHHRQLRHSQSVFRLIPLGLLLLFFFAPAPLRAQQSEEFDQYKIRVDAFWFYSNPSGTIHGTGGADVPVNFHTDLGFDTYPTFSGKVDPVRQRKYRPARSRFEAKRPNRRRGI
jgi:hypothetical protein